MSLRWLLYDGHGNLMRTMAPDYTLSAFKRRGVWGEMQGSLGAGRGYCANLGHPEDETGLVYMRARYLDAAFLSDPRGFADIVDIIGGEWNLFGGVIRVSKAYD